MHSVIHKQQKQAASVLAEVRAVAPRRPLTIREAVRVAELQAAKLLALGGVDAAPIPLDIISDQARIVVSHDFDMPDAVSGTCQWDPRARLWRITLNPQKPDTRQRFTVLHEYKHILDHGRPDLRATGRPRHYYGLPASEFIADYFAGCALMPRLLVKRAWAAGVQDLADLAVHFDVSERAMEVRLGQLRLTVTDRRFTDRHGQSTATERGAA